MKAISPAIFEIAIPVVEGSNILGTSDLRLLESVRIEVSARCIQLNIIYDV
jgi:hypothetical protein